MNRNSRGFVQVFVLIILALFVVGGIGYYAYKSGRIKLTPSQKQEVIPLSPTTAPYEQKDVITPTSNPVKSQISIGSKPNWNKYTNLESGLSIEYPNTYFKYQQDLKLGFLVATSSPQGGASPKFFGKNDVWLSASGMTTKSQTLDEYLKSNSQYKNAQKTSVEINSIKGYKLTYTFFVGPAEPMITSYVYEALVLKENKIFTIGLSSWSEESLEKYQTTFDQILSTFKFLDKRENLKNVCEESEGTWLPEFYECESSESDKGLDEELCTDLEGIFNGCASNLGCRHIDSGKECLPSASCIKLCKF